MGKMTSILEKYKLIEKDEEETSPDTASSNSLNETENSPSVEAYETTPEEVLEDDSTPMVEESTILAGDTTFVPNNEASTVVHQTTKYDHTIELSEIYSKFDQPGVQVTDTVFLLENLIHALPAELPEFVKKTTVNNIIEASAMNISKLLDDGRNRTNHLGAFIEDYRTHNESEISYLKGEIDKLSAIISEYQHQIKQKETLISEETNLIHTEQERINTILDFFK